MSFVKLEEEADEGADEEAEEKDEEDVSWGGSGMSIVTSPGVGSGGRISSDFRGRTVDLDKGLRISAWDEDKLEPVEEEREDRTGVGNNGGGENIVSSGVTSFFAGLGVLVIKAGKGAEGKPTWPGDWWCSRLGVLFCWMSSVSSPGLYEGG